LILAITTVYEKDAPDMTMCHRSATVIGLAV